MHCTMPTFGLFMTRDRHGHVWHHRLHPQLSRGMNDWLLKLSYMLMQELIQDPVVAMDGLTYERSAVLDWFVERSAGFSYFTKQRLPSKVLLPNKDYRSLVVQLIS